MRIDGVAFESPTGLEDSTSYGYQADGPLEEVSVEFELPIGRGTPAQEVITDIRESLAGYFGAGFRVLDEGDVTLAGRAGRFLRYELSGDATILGNIIVANIGPADDPTDDEGALGDWVKLAWSSEQTIADLDAYLQPITDSFVAIGDPSGQAGRTPPPGFVRHHAGPWAIDVPSRLHGPRTCIYEDPEAELRVELSVLERDEPEPELDVGVAGANAELLRRDEIALADGARIDLQLRSDDDPNGESTLILAKRELALAGALRGQTRWVVVSASGPSREDARLLAIVDDLIASVHADPG